MPTIQPRFPLGATVITPGAAAAFADTNVHPAHYLQRHRHGDWGEMPPEDQASNEEALTEGYRLMSSYSIAPHTTIWVITEADRSVTTLLLPSEY
ncbi:MULTISPECIES: hypothetical protein [Alcanivoracaceae]|jgi:hypothetical protein|uniref:Type I restriction endonuclease subunit M n=2 Tax=Alcanivoracaceae TaxID=224372 RepID=A0A9Q3W916_9GAMM|nr:MULTISPECIES: hypothetical protein [Alcanivoracaceae]KYZ86110.1 hypothetical protein A3Q32_18530 [Alcanivorax sp. KX64203]MAO58697.1 hypothetical protein [Alcanivorax sp.]MBM1145107.1 hypothetical protein [Alcanivorax sp. ZXX171]ARB47006.1 hypothetical protein P40_17640 [Alloalcanivorax xenomutans]KAF0803519.1 hypothetical protein A6D6_03691 [Alcanivorax xiamenensis]|tara:strand:- start:821 stop:1105 length:285 start_codon:yes stop_codon:yes gene_type:complete